jgi:hypothetical protein
LYGKYFYADYCNSQLQYLRDSGGVYVNTNLGSVGGTSITTFGEDKNGEIYCSSNGNKIMRLVSADCTPVAVINVGRDTVSDCGSGFALLYTPSDSNFTYSWTFNSSSVGSNSSYVATQPGVYAVSVTNQGCTGTDSVYVDFNTPAPVTFSGLDTLYCVYHNPVILIPSTPGGSFSGPGINGNGFFPANAGLGVHDIIYTLMNSYGCLSTDTQTVRVDACLGIPQRGWTTEISIVPNPATSLFYINAFSSFERKASVKITDVTGRTVLDQVYVFNQGDNSIPFELNAPAGVYLVRVADDMSSRVLKVILK